MTDVAIRNDSTPPRALPRLLPAATAAAAGSAAAAAAAAAAGTGSAAAAWPTWSSSILWIGAAPAGLCSPESQDIPYRYPGSQYRYGHLPYRIPYPMVCCGVQMTVYYDGEWRLTQYWSCSEHYLWQAAAWAPEQCPHLSLPRMCCSIALRRICP
jgi:hypothetical protein